MGFLRTILERRSLNKPSVPLTSATLIEAFTGAKSATGRVVGPETALQAAAVYACVRVRAETVASLPWPVYRRLSGGGKERDAGHAVYRLLHDAPNPEMTAIELREALVGHVDLWGNAYCEIERDGRGRAVALWPLRPDAVEIRRVNDQPVYVVTLPDGTRKGLDPSQVWHVRGFLGKSVLEYAREAIGLTLGAEEHGARFFANDARPGGVLKHPNKLTEDAALRLKQSWEAAHSGLENKHRVAVLEEGVEWQSIGVQPKDAQYMELRGFQRSEIASFFRVPPHKIGDLSRATFCLPATELVYTQHGPRSIAEIRVGDRVWSRAGDEWVLASVEASACQGVDEILEIRTGLRKLRCNARHKIPIRRRVLRPFTGGRGKCVIVDGERYRWQWEFVTVPAGEIVPGDQLLALDELPDSGKRSCPTRSVVTPEFMECLGLLVGDGFFGVSRGYETTVGFSHGATDEHVGYYREAFRRSFSQQPGPGQRLMPAIGLVPHERDANTTVFYSMAAVAELKTLGISGTATTKRVPGWIFELATDLKMAFLRGYLDADGTVSKRGQIRFVSVNQALLEDMRHLAMSVGLCPGALFHTDIKSDFGSGKEYEHRLYAFNCSRPERNARLGSHIPWYLERWNTGNCRVRTVPVYPHERKRRSHPPGVLLTTVTSVVKEKIQQPVYNISVEGTHTMIASGIYTHQSNIEHMAIEFVVDCIRPICVRFEQAANAQLFTAAERKTLFAEHVIDGLLRGDIESRYRAYATARQWGFMSANDIRELENMNPLPDEQGQTYLVPLNMVPADQAGWLEGPEPKIRP